MPIGVDLNEASWWRYFIRPIAMLAVLALVVGLFVYALQHDEGSDEAEVPQRIQRDPSRAGPEAQPATDRPTSGRPGVRRATRPSPTRLGHEVPVPIQRVVPSEEFAAGMSFGLMNAEEWNEFAILTSGRGCKFIEDARSSVEPFMTCWCLILTENYDLFERLGCDVDLEIEDWTGAEARAVINWLLTTNGFPPLDDYEFISGVRRQ